MFAHLPLAGPKEDELKYPRRVVLYHGKGYKIGISFVPPTAVGGRLVVHSTPPGYPAAKSGLLVPGDVIVTISGIMLSNLTNTEYAVELLSAKHDDHVEIEISHRLELGPDLIEMMDANSPKLRILPALNRKLSSPKLISPFSRRKKRQVDPAAEGTTDLASGAALGDVSGQLERSNADSGSHDQDESDSEITSTSDLST